METELSTASEKLKELKQQEKMRKSSSVRWVELGVWLSSEWVGFGMHK